VIPTLTEGENARRKQALESFPTISAAAKALGMPSSTLRSWRAEHYQEGPKTAVEPSEGLPEAVTVKPHYRISIDRPDGRGRTKVLAIGDAHDGPRIPKDRFRWFGRLAADTRPDMIIQIGDFLSLDSLCRYEGNDTLKGKAKPSLKQDLDSFKLALEAFSDGLGDFGPERHVCLGNHEDRIWSFTNRTPEVADLLTENLHTILTDFGWGYSPFGALHFVGGAAFTHAPLNRLGKPYGGKTAEQQIANDALHDIVFGHTHIERRHKAVKIGSGRHVTVLNLGCALPDGHREAYLGHASDGWGYGVWDLTLERGQIQAAQWIPMMVLEERYS
jgi:hypothetical protein